MVTAKIRISVNGAAIFPRKLLPPSFEWEPAAPASHAHHTPRPLQATPALVPGHVNEGLRQASGAWRGCTPVIFMSIQRRFAISNPYRSQMRANRSIRDVTRALSAAGGSISSEVCGDAGSPVGSDRSPPAAFLTNHLLRARYAIRRPECAEVEEIKGNGVPWIRLSAPTFELQPSDEGKNASKVFQLAPNVDCLVHMA